MYRDYDHCTACFSRILEPYFVSVLLGNTAGNIKAHTIMHMAVSALILHIKLFFGVAEWIFRKSFSVIGHCNLQGTIHFRKLNFNDFFCAVQSIVYDV